MKGPEVFTRLKSGFISDFYNIGEKLGEGNNNFDNLFK